MTDTPVSVDFVCLHEIILAARRNIEQGPWDKLVGGAESETTMRRNRLGFDRLAFRPRILRDVSRIDPSTTFMGHPLRIPVLLCPMGVIDLYGAAGAVDSAKAAEEFGTVHVVSSGARPGLEATAACSMAPKVLQFSARGDMFRDDSDREPTEEFLSRVVRAGYAGLCLTVDTSGSTRSERMLLHRYSTPERMITPDSLGRASRTWDTMDRIKGLAGLPFLLKGIATAEDAAIAVEHGVDVVWISNHGGRQMDHGRGTIEVLPEVVEAVAGRAAIVLDGGIQRGTDVLKAIALGATAVGIGRLQGYGLAAGGAAGVVRVLEILEDEILGAMGALGVRRLEDLDPSYLCEAEPVGFPHEMSQFVNLPEGQVR